MQKSLLQRLMGIRYRRMFRRIDQIVAFVKGEIVFVVEVVFDVF